MKKPTFDSQGRDATTFAPIILIDFRDTQWKEVHLSFDNWDALLAVAEGEDVDGYYLNGYGVQCLVMACRANAGLEVETEGIVYDSEANTCFIHFTELDEAVRTAELLQPILQDKSRLEEMVHIAREHGFED